MSTTIHPLDALTLDQTVTDALDTAYERIERSLRHITPAEREDLLRRRHGDHIADHYATWRHGRGQ